MNDNNDKMANKILVLIALIFAISIISIILFMKTGDKLSERDISNEKFCISDDDCSCGVKIDTGECFVGNKNFVNPDVQCPDFCTGVHGKFKTKCINNECKLVMS